MCSALTFFFPELTWSFPNVFFFLHMIRTACFVLSDPLARFSNKIPSLSNSPRTSHWSYSQGSSSVPAALPLDWMRNHPANRKSECDAGNGSETSRAEAEPGREKAEMICYLIQFSFWHLRRLPLPLSSNERKEEVETIQYN